MCVCGVAEGDAACSFVQHARWLPPPVCRSIPGAETCKDPGELTGGREGSTSGSGTPGEQELHKQGALAIPVMAYAVDLPVQDAGASSMKNTNGYFDLA